MVEKTPFEVPQLEAILVRERACVLRVNDFILTHFPLSVVGLWLPWQHALRRDTTESGWSHLPGERERLNTRKISKQKPEVC